MPESLASGVYIAALGASTSVGRDAWSSAAAVRAGVSGFVEHPYAIDSAGEPLRVASAPWLDPDCAGVDRFDALLWPAVEQALAPLGGSSAASLRVALAIGLPEARPGLPDDLESHVRERLSARFPQRFVATATFSAGHAAGLIAMQAALVKMAAGAFDACVVAGVDSYLSPETLTWLEECDQVHGAGPLNNAWGLIPGEAAGAVLFVGASAVDALRLDPMARMLSVGRGFEQNRIKTETVCIGEGLTTAFRESLAVLPPGAQVTDVYCDMNGEPYRADEFGFATLRTKEAFASASDFVAPADCWGDVSAASAPLFLMLSAIAAKKAYAKGEYAFLWASSEGGERGAALLQSELRERE